MTSLTWSTFPIYQHSLQCEFNVYRRSSFFYKKQILLLNPKKEMEIFQFEENKRINNFKRDLLLRYFCPWSEIISWKYHSNFISNRENERLYQGNRSFNPAVNSVTECYHLTMVSPGSYREFEMLLPCIQSPCSQ